MSQRDPLDIDGSCHCGNIEYVLRWPSPDAEMPVRKCGCTFCRKHAGTWTSHRDAELTIRIVDESTVNKYRFGTKTADFYICSRCGIVPFVLSEIDKNRFAVVNVNTLEDVGRVSLTSSATNFDGESTDARIDRRKLNWIPEVRIGESGIMFGQQE